MPATSIQAQAGTPGVAANTNEYAIGVNTTDNSIVVRDSTGANIWPIAAKGGMQMAEVSVSAAELAAIRATPKTLVAAPGAGFMLVFRMATLILDYTAPGFTESADNLAVKYTDGSGVAVSETIEMTGFIDQTADTITFAVPDAGAATALSAATNIANKALVLHNTGDGEFGGSGGSTLRVKVWYNVVPTGL
jgi:hypothetical protein